MRVQIVKARLLPLTGPSVSSIGALALTLFIVASLTGCSSNASSKGRNSERTPAAQSSSTSSAATPSTQTSQASTNTEGHEGIPAFTHVFVVVMENLSEEAALSTPSIAALAHRYAIASSYYAVSHPSLPNYLALVSGSTWGISTDCTSCYVSAPNLAVQLQSADISWGAYFEAMPAPCFFGPEADGGLYAQKHNPFIYFDDIRAQPGICEHLQPLSSLTAVLSQNPSQIPRFVWVTPDMCHDGHDCSAATAGAWLSGFVSTVTASPAWQGGGAMFIVWDEGSDDSGLGAATGAITPSGGGGHILALVVAPRLPQGDVVAVPYDDYSLLRTIEDSFDLPLLQNASAQGVKPLSAFWTRSAGATSGG